MQMVKQSTTQEQNMELLDMYAFWTFQQEWPDEEPDGAAVEDEQRLETEMKAERQREDSNGAADTQYQSGFFGGFLAWWGKRKLFLLHNTA